MWLSTGSVEKGNGYSDARKVKGKIKEKLNHRSGHEGPRGRSGKALNFLQLWRYMAVCGQSQASAALPRERDPVPFVVETRAEPF